MIAAAVAVMVGAASAELCDEVIGPPDGCALYNVKFQFKTLAGKDAKCTAAQLAAAGCLAIDAQIANKGIAYLDNATRTFDGVLWQCKSTCFEGTTPNDPAYNDTSINYVLWEKKTEMLVSDKVTYTPPANGVAANWTTPDEALKFQILGRYGAKANKVAAYWMPTIEPQTLAPAGVTITAAGFGSFDTKKSVIKNVSGNAVAKLIPTSVKGDGTVCTDGTDKVAVLAYMCHTFKSWCCCDCVAATLAPASGTWSIKYNASASKNGKLSKIIPSYCM